MADPNLNVNITGTDHLTGELKRVESSVIRFVGAISAAMSAIAVIGFPIAESIKFQTALLDAARTTQYNAAQIALLRDALRDLSTQINVSAPDLAKIATLGGQMGIGMSDPSALVAFSKTVATAVSAMGLPADEVVNSFGKLINIFNIPANKFENAMSALTAVGNASAVSASQLFDVVRRVGDLGGSASFPQAIALSAAMVDLGMSAEVAGTSLTKIFSDFKAKAPEFASRMQQYGINSTKEWINLVQTDGMAALSMYTDLLNSLPIEEASALKAKLTGQGRLFEGVSKLQAQRQREMEWIGRLKVAETDLLAIKQKITAASGESTVAGNSEYQSLQNRVNAYRQAATQASVLARLSQVSADAYKAGDAAAKAQAIILSGVAAQWQLFSNTVSKVLGSIGDVALPPLTNLLASMRAELNDPINSDGVRKASEDILGALQIMAKAVSSFRTSISGGGGFDWGALLHLSALAIGIAVIKGTAAVMSSLGGAAAGSFPALAKLNALLFGTSEASRKAAAALAEATAQTARTGGLLNLSGASSNTTKSVLETKRLVDMQTRLNTVAGQWNTALAAAQAEVTRLYASAFPKLQSIGALENKILETTVKLDVARSLGTASGTRSAGQYEGQLRRLTAQLVAVEAAQNAVNRSTSAVSRLGNLSTRVDTRLQQLDPIAGVSSILPQLQSMATSAGTAFTSAFTRAARLGPAITSAFVTGAAQGRNSIERFTLGAVAVTVAGANAVASSALRMAVSIKSFVGDSILSLTGYTAAWEATSSTVWRSIMRMEMGVILLTKAIRGVMSLALKLVSFVFLAEMLRDVLKLIGVWDSLATVISAVLNKMGIPIPGFLQSDADAKKLAQTLALIEAGYAGAKAEASKMNPQLQELITRAQELSLITKDLTFNPNTPQEAEKNLNATFDAIMVGYADEEVAQAQLLAIEEQRTLKNKELASLLTRQKTAFPGIGALDSYLGITEKSIAGVRASLQKLDDDQASIIAGSTAYGDLGEALRKVITVGVDAASAEALFTKSAETGKSKIQDYTDAIVKYLDAQEKASVQKNTVADAGLTAASSKATAGDEAYMRREAAIKAATVSEVALKKAVDDTRASFGAIAAPGTIMAGILDRMAKSTSKKALSDISAELTRMRENMVQFQGKSLPNIAVSNLLDATAMREATKAKADMYTEWAKMAKSAADATVNAATEALKTVAAYAKATEDALIKADEISNAMKRKAADNAADKVTDAKTKLRVDAVRQEFSEKQRTLAAEQDLRKQYEGENAYTRKRDAEQAAALAAEEKKITDAILEQVDAQKARRAVDDRIASSNKLVDSVFKYGELIKAANKELETPNLSAEKQVAIIAKAKDAYDKMVASGGEAKKQLEDILATPPVGSIRLVSDEEIARSKIALSSLNTAMASGTTELNSKLHATYQSASEKFSAMAAGLTKELESLNTSYAVMLKTLGNEGPAAVELIDAMFRSTGKLSEMVAKVKSDTAKGLIDSTAMASLDTKTYVDAWTTEMKNLPALALAAVKGGIPIPVTADTTTFTQVVESQKPTVVISPQFGPNAAFDLKRTLDAMNLSVNIEGKVTVKNAKGGFVGNIDHFAGGGSVSGPGTGTSDSILSWLSNGEYVMDALTTSRFGPNFFKGLQNAARGGFSGSFLGKLGMPAFAAGGPVSLNLPTAIMPASSSAAAAVATRSSVDINLNVGGQRISLFGERQQADKLVQALKRMEVSA